MYSQKLATKSIDERESCLGKISIVPSIYPISFEEILMSIFRDSLGGISSIDGLVNTFASLTWGSNSNETSLFPLFEIQKLISFSWPLLTNPKLINGSNSK